MSTISGFQLMHRDHIHSKLESEEQQSLFTGQPATIMPLAVGQDASSQCSPFAPHQVELLFSMPTEK